jgi:hypothetical protein
MIPASKTEFALTLGELAVAALLYLSGWSGAAGLLAGLAIGTFVQRRALLAQLKEITK